MSTPTSYFVHTLLRARDWQHRPQLDDVCDWWRSGGSRGGVGVCSLVGIGGAGKTAIADRFLQLLPDVLPVNPDVPKGTTLAVPHSVFVFSFYDAPNSDAFFNALEAWLRQTVPSVTVAVQEKSTGGVSYHQVMQWLQGAPPGLLILDGLEKIQQDGTRGGIFGRLADGNLRDFLARLSNGYLPHLSAVITSRFPVADLDEVSPTWYRHIDIDEIDVQTGIDLLRQRGVTGNDDQLKAIVENCGRHALTVDMAGGLLCEFHDGDPATILAIGTAKEIDRAASKEQDPRRRAVLKQELRFAKVAARYRESFEQRDRAALALLERVCLFRLGVDAETLTSIFTGKGSQKAAGHALSRLSPDKLQKKLDLLVRMGLLEASESEISNAACKIPIRYTIHPAVRDGFLKGISRDAALAGHEAVRKGLEVSLTASLGDGPGKNPSDPATLDLLEEIVHHTLQSGHITEAWDIYKNRIGGTENMVHRLVASARGLRICTDISNYIRHQNQGKNAKNRHALLLHADVFEELALFWLLFGGLRNAESLFLKTLQICRSIENWFEISQAERNLCQVYTLQGKLGFGNAVTAAEDAVSVLKSDADPWSKVFSYAFRAWQYSLSGQILLAIDGFNSAESIQGNISGNAGRKLYSLPGVFHADLLNRLGRCDQGRSLTEENLAVCNTLYGCDHLWSPECQLLISSFSIQHSGAALSAGSSSRLWTQARDWALARDAKEVLCWSYLVEAQHALATWQAEGVGLQTSNSSNESEENSPADAGGSPVHTALEAGLKIARDCGYGLYHIDLLLTRARLHLLEGHADEALDDIRIALDDGIPFHDTTGQPELLAARAPECGYAWAIPEGLQLRAEGLLLKAAQELGTDSIVPAKRDQRPPETHELITQAQILLHEAMELWQPLHDPEPERDDQNFQLNGKPYNYKAAETHRVATDLQGGILTVCSMKHVAKSANSGSAPIDRIVEESTMPVFDVFLSHNSKDKPDVKRLGEALKKRKLTVWLDEWELRPGLTWQNALEDIISGCKAAAVCLGDNGIGPWEDPEMQALLRRFVEEKKSGKLVPIIPVLLPGAPDDATLPLFLQAFTWVDLRDGLKKESLDRLEWGITGIKPTP